MMVRKLVKKRRSRTQKLATDLSMYRVLIGRSTEAGQHLEAAELYAHQLAPDNGRRVHASLASQHTREIAEALERVIEVLTQRAAAIEAKYGHVFRTAAYISGKYLAPYQTFSVTPSRVSEARRLRSQALTLTRKFERQSAKIARKRARRQSRSV
jgi:hypothetical protein